MRFALVRGELPPAGTARHLRPAIGVEVAEFPSGLDEEIAGVDVAVMLDHHVGIAAIVHGAGAGFLSR